MWFFYMDSLIRGKTDVRTHSERMAHIGFDLELRGSFHCVDNRYLSGSRVVLRTLNNAMRVV
jgi:hypothetical protein